MQRKGDYIRRLCGVAAAVSLLCAAWPASAEAPSSADAPPESVTAAAAAGETASYADYRAAYPAAPAGSRIVLTPESAWEADGDGVTTQTDVQGEPSCWYLPESTTLRLRVEAAAAGRYTLRLRYLPAEGKGVELERALRVNGAVPYEEASHLLLPRVWVNATEVQKDIYGNDIRPSQIEHFRWQERLLQDSNGYYGEPLSVYLEQGENTLELTMTNEPMWLASVTLAAPETLPDYETQLAAWRAAGAEEKTGLQLRLQGEAADYKSSATLYPLTDRTSPATDPYEPSITRLNTIGGSRWAYPGRSLTWVLEVPESGLYRIAVKARQNLTSGILSARRLYIDDKVPFAEADVLTFPYDSAWGQYVLGGEEPYLFYLEQGTHELRLEVVLGEMGPILRETEDILLGLNRIYREILIITGSSPDLYRDYKLAELIPETIEEISVQYERLTAVIEAMQRLTGEDGSDNLGTLRTVARQLKSMADDPDRIARKFSYFKTNIGSLGTWLNQNHEMPLEIDYITVYTADQELPPAEAGLWETLVFRVRRFIDSFVLDYDAIGNLSVSENMRTVTVWISSGRDQSQTLKSILNDSFVPETGIGVNLQLVQASTLLSATIAGIGPDVALGVGMGDPVNYALRGAVTALDTMEDFSAVRAWFGEELFVPYELNGHTYALPETQSFPMLFYRTDILQEMGLSVPQTWSDVVAAISVLNKQNMEFGLSGTVDVNMLYMLLMQNGGSLYNAEGSATLLDSDAAVDAFKQWTNFYVNYKVSQEMDILNRFRVGEVPIAIADYSLYNSLQVSAPEIKSLWAFTSVPGTVREDGNVDRSAVLSSTAAVMMADIGDPEAAWSFLRWWVSADTQTRYGNEMESILGESARYPTANPEAFSRLPWSVTEYGALQTQLAASRGVRQVPGCYYLSRHLTNAFRQVVQHDKDPKDTLLDYVYTINGEITSKRREFHME